MTEAFIIASVFLSLAVLLVPLANRIGLGSVLGYLFAGAIIGVMLTYMAPLIGFKSDELLEQLNHASEFGVVLMLFLIGLEIQPSQLWRMKSTIMAAGGLQVGLTALLVMLIAILVFDLTWQMGLAIGLTLALSSTAIIMQTLSEKGWQNSIGGKASFAALLFQDIAVIPIIAILPLLAMSTNSAHQSHEEISHGLEIVSYLPSWAQPFVVVIAIVIVYILSRFLINPLFHYIAKARQKEIFTTAALGLVTLIAAIMSLLGISPALGVFIAGVILSESEYRHQIEADIEPFKGLLLGIFFMTVGAAFNFTLFASEPYLVLSLTVALISTKALVLFMVGKVLKLKKIEHALFFLALAQGGEFAFVLLTLAVSNTVLPVYYADILRIVVALSMAITPLLFIFYEKVLLPRSITPDKSELPDDEINEQNCVIIAGVGRFGQIVGRMMQHNNFKVTALDNDPNMIDTLRIYGWKVFYGDATRLDLLNSAGIENAKVLVIAMDDPDKVLDLTRMILQHYPHIELFVRARDRVTAYQLYNLGIINVFRETFESSASLGEAVLKEMGLRAYQAKRAKLLYQREDELLVRDLAQSWQDDKEKHIIYAQQKYANLSEVLQNDVTHHIEEQIDLGWFEDRMNKSEN
jgi:monovalent cation:proton antiporter-2 (CPA2) family protein